MSKWWMHMKICLNFGVEEGNHFLMDSYAFFLFLFCLSRRAREYTVQGLRRQVVRCSLRRYYMRRMQGDYLRIRNWSMQIFDGDHLIISFWLRSHIRSFSASRNAIEILFFFFVTDILKDRFSCRPNLTFRPY